MEEKNRKTGIDIIGDVPWGTHFCQFYQTKEDLIDILVPYFKAGLENNEFCMWVTSEPLGEKEAREAMQKAVSDLDQYLKKGQIEIVPYTEWYLKDGVFNLQRVLNAWIDKLNQALAKGYDGLRLTGNTAWLEKRGWENFTQYEEEVNNAIGKYQMIAICTYSLDKCGASEVIDVVKNHQFALIKREGKWESIENSERKKAEEMLRESEKKYRTLLENLPQLIFLKDKNSVYISSNKNYCKSLGIKPEEIKGKTDFDFYPKELAQKYRKDDWEVMRTGKTMEVVEEYIEKKEKKIVQTVKTPVLGNDGKPMGVLGIFWDITERKKTEEALRESEERYRALFEGSAGGILVADIETKEFKYANPAICRMFGYTEDELKKLSVADIHPKETLEHVASDFEAQARGEKTLAQELPCLRKDGSIIYADISATKVTIDDREFNTGFFIDVTERKRAEEAHSRLLSIINATPDFVGFADGKTTNILYINPAGRRMTGVGYEEDVTKLKISDVHPEWVNKLLRDEIIPVAIRDGIWTGECAFLNRNGREIPVMMVLIAHKSPNNEVERFSTISRDITERKKAEESLKESEERYRLLIENQGEGIVTSDLEENFIFTNPAAEKIFGVTKGGLVGRNLKEFTSPEQFNFIREQIKRRGSGEKDSYEIAIMNAKGEKHFLLLTATPWFNKDGVLTATFGIFRDITERRQLQQQLIQSEKLATVGTLAYGIAHEFNNILAGMLANAELGLITQDSRQIKECFEIIADNSHRAASIANNLLVFTRQKEARKELIDITEPLRSVLAVTRRDLEKLNLEIVEKFKPIPKIYCDAGQLSEVFLNMVTNARDAMREKGGKLTIQVEPYEDNIRIVFKDTGCGIPEEIKDKIFEPFVTTKGALGGSEIPGTGLGLFLSYGIIDGYQGRIEVESKVGKGTQFTILIPVSKNSPPQPIHEIKIEPSLEIGRKLRILLVEDEKAILSGLKKFLESRGYQVTASLRGKEGLKLFKKEKYDIVLSDITMPDMDGIELIKKIKEQDQKTKVIVITGHIMREMEEKAKEAGADEVLIKPFKNDVLCSAISKLI